MNSKVSQKVYMQLIRTKGLASRGQLAVVTRRELKMFLDCDAHYNIPEIGGSIVLRYVANHACCELLIDDDVDVFARNEFGLTTLISLTRSKDCVPVLKRLVEAKVDVNARDKADKTALVTIK